MELKFKTKFLNVLRTLFKNIFFEKVLCYYTQGKSPTHILTKIIPNNYQYRIGSIRKVTRNGINFNLDISDLVDWYIYFGLKDIAHIELYSLCKKGYIVLDIGTNIGSVLMNIANTTGKEGYVYGFEPDSTNYNKCINNLKLNDFNNICVEQIGVGDKKEELYLVVNTEQNRGMNRIGDKGLSNGNVITIITVDDFVETKKLQRVNLIKIDVEGFEFNVLKGARLTLSRFKPVLFIELDDNNLKEQGHSALELIGYLLTFNYNIIHAENKNIITNTSDFTNCHYDIICKI